jgi:hypothetical protein
MSDQESFRRGQVTWALWQTFSRHNAADPRRAAIPQAFATRVRKMQEFGVPLPREERPGRAGVDAQYTPYQAFEIGVGLDLQDNGLNQAEIGFFLRSIRPELRGVYDRIMASPPVPHGRFLARDRPASPPAVHVEGADPQGLGDPRRREQADTAVFMCFRYVAVEEAWNTPAFDASDWEGRGRHPFFLRPTFHYGLRSLMEQMERLAVSVGDRIRTVVELGNLAVVLLGNLRRAPPIRRGRP